MARRTRLNRPYPTHSLQDVLPISETIQEVNGGRPVETGLLAESLGTSVKSSAFIQKLNSSSKYGLTIGSHSDVLIELTDLGEMLTAPTSFEERSDAIRQAALAPDVFRSFYEAYEGKRMPEDVYAANTLTRQLGVHAELAEECLRIIRRNGLFAEIIADRSGALVVEGTREAEAPESASESAPRAPDSTKRDTGDADGRAAEDERGGVLVVADGDDRAGMEALDLVRGLGVPAVSADLDLAGAALVSESFALALRTARGCVFVWPGGTLSNYDETGEGFGPETARAWAALGATVVQLGQRTVVLYGQEDDGASAVKDLSGSIMAVGHSRSANLFSSLMTALIASGIIKVSVG